MNFVIGRCKHEPTKYCKNWDGKGNMLKITSLSADATVNSKIRCPRKRKSCPFKIEAIKSRGFLNDHNTKG